MKKLLIYYNFILLSIVTIMGFVGATNIPQLVSAILFFPLAAYFMLLVLPRKKRALIMPGALLGFKLEEDIKETAKKETAKKGKQDKKPIELKKAKIDVDRRMFLKLIGSAGLSVFLLSIFTKKAQGAFFGSVPGPGTVSLKDIAGAKIDPAEKHPTDGYKITEIDDAGSDAYTGFIKKGGAWYIIKEIGSGSDASYRYTKGASDFTTNWTNRTSLSYGYFDSVF